MAYSRVTLNYEYIPDPDKGKPISNGSIYIGEPDTDPEVVGNQKQVYALEEDGSFTTLSQPISTGAGGLPEYNGDPIQLYVNGPYSLKILNAQDSQVYYDAGVINETVSTFEIDYSEDDQGVQGNGGTIYAYCVSIGAVKKATLILPHSDFVTGYSYYTFKTTFDMTAYPNIKIAPENGAIIKDSTDNPNLSLGEIQAQPHQRIFNWGNGSGSLSIDPTQTKEVYPEWFGATPDGVTAGQEVFINQALDCGEITVRLLRGTYLLSGAVIINSYNRLIGDNFLRSTLALDDSVDENVIETYEFTNWDTYLDGKDASWDGDIQHLLPQGFEIRDLKINGNKDNNSAGHGLAINGIGYVIDNITVYNCAENGWYSYVERDMGVNGPALTSIDALPETKVTRLTVRKCEGTGISYQGPNDAYWNNITTSGSVSGKGMHILSDINIGYIHSYSNDLVNFHAEAGFTCSHLEARDGLDENVIIDTAGVFNIDSCYSDNSDRDGDGVSCFIIEDGSGTIGNLNLFGKVSGTQDVLEINGGSPKFGQIRINSNGGSGKAVTASAGTFIEVQSIEVEGFAATAEAGLFEWGADRSHIGSIIMNSSGMVRLLSGAEGNIIDSILINSPNDAVTTYCCRIDGTYNNIGKMLFRNITNTYGVQLSSTSNKNILGPSNFLSCTLTKPIIDQQTGSENLIQKGYGDEEVITTDAQTLSIHGVTRLDTTSGALAGTLPDAGDNDGELKTIMMQTHGAGNDYTLSVTNHVSGSPTAFVFTASGAYITLRWIRNKYHTVDYYLP